MTTTSKTRALTEAALMVALAAALSYLPFKLPNGGSVNCSMLPIVLFAFKYNLGWGMMASVTYALIQMFTGFYPPPVQNLSSFAAVILLDYIIAFSVLGVAGVLFRRFERGLGEKGAMIASCGIVYFVRFLCHFASGIIIWHVYAGDMAAWLYSLLYNGSYMLAEFVISSAFLALVGGRLRAAMGANAAA